MSAPRIPVYRHHRGVGQAYVCVKGQQIYLGKFGSPESRERYSRVIAEIFSSPVAKPVVASASAGLTVIELAAAYWRHASVYYVKDGKPTGQLPHVRVALRALRDLYGEIPAAEFGPLKLKAVQQHFIEKGSARRYINDTIGGIRRVFRWATAEELVPPAVYQSLTALPGLKRGRTTARETEPIGPVADEIVEATLLQLRQHVADLVRFQRFTGCRPGEACIVRPCDIDTNGEIWLYTPHRFKTEHHGRARVIFVGPKAQEVLRQYLDRDPTGYCFSPAKGKRALRHYSKDSYNRAIRRACDRAKLSAWCPNQLRHAAGTEARRRFGLEAAQVLLGHAHADVTQIYAEQNTLRGIEIARTIG